MSKIKITEDRFSRLQMIGWWDQKRLSQAKIMVVGAGALGNEVIKNLALYGIGNILIIDFDKIEESNLTRAVLFRETDVGRYKAEVAAERVKEIYSGTKVMWLNSNIVSDIGLGVFRQMDAIIGCLDNREARFYLNKYAWRVGKPWIDGGIQEIMGTFAVFDPRSPESACYECTLTDEDYKILNIRYSCPLLKREDILSGKSPTTPSISSIIGGFQVQEAIKILHNIKVNPGTVYFINGRTNLFDYIKFERKEDCQSHLTYEPIIEIDDESQNLTFSDLIDIGSKYLKGEDIYVNLDRDILIKFVCLNCGKEEYIYEPLSKVSEEKEICPYCGKKRKFEATNIIRKGDELASKQLTDLGLPKFHIYEVTDSNNSVYLEIKGDMDQVLNFK